MQKVQLNSIKKKQNGLEKSKQLKNHPPSHEDNVIANNNFRHDVPANNKIRHNVPTNINF